MTTLLDTDVVIHLRDGDPSVTANVAALAGAVLMSILTRVELEGGVYRDPAAAGIRRARLDAILEAIPRSLLTLRLRMCTGRSSRPLDTHDESCSIE